MSEIKRLKRGPTTHIRLMSGTVEYTDTMSCTVEYTDTMSCTVEYTEGCPGRKGDGKCRAAERADSASHVEGADAQGKCRDARKTARVSHNACHVGSAYVSDDAQSKYHAVKGTANHAEGTANHAVNGIASQTAVGAATAIAISSQANSNGDSSGSPGHKMAESSSRGNFESRQKSRDSRGN